MGVSVKIDPVEKDIAAMIRADLSPQMQQKEAAAFARAGIDEAKATNRQILGRDPPLTITVDGRKGAPLESVKPDGGTIIAEFELMEDVLRWIADELVRRSPVTSGAYQKGHTLFVDGTEVPLGGQIPIGEEYVFINLVPYARRIEVGKTKSGRDFLIQVPNHIYERTAKDAKRRFGNQADIQFAFREAIGTYRLKHDQVSRSWKKGGGWYHSPTQRKDRVKGSAVIPPAIIIKSRKS